MKVCHIFELKTPTNQQITNIYKLKLMPQLENPLSLKNIVKIYSR